MLITNDRQLWAEATCQAILRYRDLEGFMDSGVANEDKELTVDIANNIDDARALKDGCFAHWRMIALTEDAGADMEIAVDDEDA